MPPVGFPGRRAILERLLDLAAAGRLGQAFLFFGAEGSGKEVTALELARRLNCSQSPVCSRLPLCESCRKAVTFQHPDLRWLGPAPASLSDAEVAELLAAKREQPFHQAPFATTSELTIGSPDHPGPLTVRSLLRFLRLQPFQGRHKVAVVADAHRLTAEAGNALLKTLEEPPSAALLILLTSNRAALLPTLVSRCRAVRFEPYSETELAALLIDLGEKPALARATARLADGNARKAIALGQPADVALRKWAGELCERLHEGRDGDAQLAAEMLHKGVVPASVSGETERVPAAADLATRRERAMRLCELLNMYYSELLACCVRGADWRPRLLDSEARVRALASQRSGAALARDIARIETAKGEIDGNLNIGLSMAVLLQGLIDNAKRDRVAGRA